MKKICTCRGFTSRASRVVMPSSLSQPHGKHNARSEACWHGPFPFPLQLLGISELVGGKHAIRSVRCVLHLRKRLPKSCGASSYLPKPKTKPETLSWTAVLPSHRVPAGLLGFHAHLCPKRTAVLLGPKRARFHLYTALRTDMWSAEFLCGPGTSFC